MSEPLKLAIQKSGRLSDDSIKLIKESGLKYKKSARKLKTKVSNFPLELFFLRDDDIPAFVQDGTVDIGIVGENVLAEADADIEIARRLGFAKCRLSIALPREVQYTGVQDLQGKRIATTYERILGGYLQEHGVQASIQEISGSVEIAPGIGLADAVCDIVSTGSTLLSNGLKEVEAIFHSEAVLVSRKALAEDKRQTLNELLFRIDAVLKARKYKYIMLNVPNDQLHAIHNMMPGLKAPTTIPLGDSGWSAVQTVVREKHFWSIVDELQQLGAEGIIVLPIEKMVGGKAEQPDE